jgi:hypothetical protein
VGSALLWRERASSAKAGRVPPRRVLGQLDGGDELLLCDYARGAEGKAERTKLKAATRAR